MKILEWHTDCLLNIANYLGVKITEKGEVFSRKSNLQPFVETFMPKSEVFLNQLANKVERLDSLVENFQFQKDPQTIIDTKTKHN